MSYGQPCRRMTGRPEAGPASAYPIFRTPASICFTGPKDALSPDCARTAAIDAVRPAAWRRKLLRFGAGPSDKLDLPRRARRLLRDHGGNDLNIAVSRERIRADVMPRFYQLFGDLSIYTGQSDLEPGRQAVNTVREPQVHFRIDCHRIRKR